MSKIEFKRNISKRILIGRKSAQSFGVKKRKMLQLNDLSAALARSSNRRKSALGGRDNPVTIRSLSSREKVSA